MNQKTTINAVLKLTNQNLMISAKTVAFSFMYYSLLSCSPQSKTTENSKFNSLEASQNSSSRSSIVGGQLADATFQKENGIVQLKLISADGSGSGTCTGSLIAKNIVVTAAHCIADLGEGRVAVLFSLDDKNLTRDQVRVGIQGTIHPEYNPEADSNQNSNDIAVIKLNSDAPEDFKPIPLPTAQLNELQAEARLTLAGFGKTNPIQYKEVINPFTRVKRYVRVPSEGTGTLRQIANQTVRRITEDQKEIVLKQNNNLTPAGACQGDSGGPALLEVNGQNILVGVTSRGTHQLGNCVADTIYTSVVGQIDWLNSEIQKLNNPEQVVAVTSN